MHFTAFGITSWCCILFYLSMSQVALTYMAIKMFRQPVNMEFERTWSWHKLRHDRDVWLEGLRKLKKNISQESRSPGQNLKAQCTISGFCCGVNQVCAPLECYEALTARWLLSFRDSIFTGQAVHEEFECLTPEKMELTGCPETWETNYRSTMHNIPEQQIPWNHNFLKISDNERNYKKKIS
jgi:hypothetical protein